MLSEPITIRVNNNTTPFESITLTKSLDSISHRLEFVTLANHTKTKTGDPITLLEGVVKAFCGSVVSTRSTLNIEGERLEVHALSNNWTLDGAQWDKEEPDFDNEMPLEKLFSLFSPIPVDYGGHRKTLIEPPSIPPGTEILSLMRTVCRSIGLRIFPNDDGTGIKIRKSPDPKKPKSLTIGKDLIEITQKNSIEDLYSSYTVFGDDIDGYPIQASVTDHSTTFPRPYALYSQQISTKKTLQQKAQSEMKRRKMYSKIVTAKAIGWAIDIGDIVHIAGHTPYICHTTTKKMNAKEGVTNDLTLYERGAFELD